ncbi:hypothetical protein ACFX13_039641 [Malus domestica]
MGCCYSRVEREEMVSICKSRKRYMKQLVKTRQAWSAAHTMYLCSLRSTGSALLQFLNAQQLQPPPQLQSSPPQQLPVIAVTTTNPANPTTASATTSTQLKLRFVDDFHDTLNNSRTSAATATFVHVGFLGPICGFLFKASDKRRVGSYDYRFGGDDHRHCGEHGETAVGGEWIFEKERDDDK